MLYSRSCFANSLSLYSSSALSLYLSVLPLSLSLFLVEE